MSYLARNLDQRLDPSVLLEGARSIIVTALSYHQPCPGEEDCGDRPTSAGGPRGRIAMYAWGEDYHVVLKDKLFALAQALGTELGEPFDFKVCVDTAPLLEREVAAAAGLGWIGKNTLVLNRDLGSYFFLGALLTTLELAPDPPSADHCGTCSACLDACPTAAFPAAYEMDASRCISYLTIERRAPIPADLADRTGEWLFGCDVCQQVCPFNRSAPHTREPRFAVRPPAPAVELAEVLSWGPEQYRAALRGTAMKRATLEMWQRNARLAQEHAADQSPRLTTRAATDT